MRIIFLEKPYTKYGGETIPRHFSKKSKCSIPLDLKLVCFIQFVFIICQVEGCRNILKLSCRPFVFTSSKDFLMQCLELVSLPHFLHGF